MTIKNKLVNHLKILNLVIIYFYVTFVYQCTAVFKSSFFNLMSVPDFSGHSCVKPTSSVNYCQIKGCILLLFTCKLVKNHCNRSALSSADKDPNYNIFL